MPDSAAGRMSLSKGVIQMREGKGKKQYDTPELQDWGTVRELTATGMTNPGGDAKQGSVLSRGQ